MNFPGAMARRWITRRRERMAVPRNGLVAGLGIFPVILEIDVSYYFSLVIVDGVLDRLPGLRVNVSIYGIWLRAFHRGLRCA